jgi:undecaprenyl diphosphate synthase
VQSPFQSAALPRLHVAVIMDGNGRWANARGLPRTAGHAAGARAVRRTVEAAVRLGDVGTLTLYAFSGDNWRRPPGEVASLMRLFRRYLAAETPRCVEQGVRVTVIGRRDRLPAALCRSIEATEAATSCGGALHLRIALDYSARDTLLRAAALAAASPPQTRDDFAALIGDAEHGGGPAPEVDLLVRTGGEQRLSDFLLWECAYAELLFLTTMWPDFDAVALERALHDFRARERRFGALPDARVG